VEGQALLQARRLIVLVFALFVIGGFNLRVEAKETIDSANITEPSLKRLVYIVSDTKIPFWSIMGKGIQSKAESLGYKLDIYSANNNAKHELELVVKSIKEKVSGLIISPTTSSAAATILKFAKKSGIPVVISDIGADSGDYVSYISSDNSDGAYKIGRILAKEMVLKGWEGGSVGIIAIPQKRANGQARTAGFMRAMNEKGLKTVGIFQQINFSYQETYDFSNKLVHQNPGLRAIWLQGSDRYQAALDAITDVGRQGEILLVCFDAEPVFLELIPKGVLLGAAMQQPYLMGQKAVAEMDKHFNGKDVIKDVKLPVLAISGKNIREQLSLIQKNVLGLSVEDGGDDNAKK